MESRKFAGLVAILTLPVIGLGELTVADSGSGQDALSRISMMQSSATAPVAEHNGPKFVTDANGYLIVSLAALSEFRVAGGKHHKLPAIPPHIMSLNGKKVAVRGFLMPIQGDEEGTSDFVILKNQGSCCYGIPPRVNEWIWAETHKGAKVAISMDLPLTVYGTFTIKETFVDEEMTGFYHLLVDAVEH